jgi:hypothetical protein
MLTPLIGCDPPPAPPTEPPQDELEIRWIQDVVDECGGACGSLTNGRVVSSIQGIESNRDGFLRWDLADDDSATFCISDRLSPGDHTIAVHHHDGSLSTNQITVEPFGWSLGLSRPPTPFKTLPWLPEYNGLTDPPAFSPEADSWDSYSVMMPSVVSFNGREWLYYAGTEEEDFAIGVASRAPGETHWNRESDRPILQDDGQVNLPWRQYAQNTPEALAVNEELWLYYTGRAAADGQLAIGLATSQDGVHFDDHEANPLIQPSGVLGSFDEAAVAHPSVLLRDGSYEMWFASGTLAIGYALSTDGINWEPYCDNPVFTGVESSWDRGKVKAPEVSYDGETYWMTYSGCGQGCYEVGWAASTDGTTWTQHDSPWIPRAPAPAWNSFGVQAAFINDAQTPWEIWYTGTGDASGDIGIITLSDTSP